MTIQNWTTDLQKSIRDNSTTILSAVAVSGSITTAYLASVAGYRTAVYLSEKDPHMTKQEIVKQVWKFYIPAGASGLLTIGCVISAQRVGTRKTAAAQAAFAVSERALVEYREKVVEQFGTKKDQAIRDEIAQDQIDKTGGDAQILVTGPGQVLCCEGFTGRYFISDMESLRKAQNDINAKLLSQDWAYLEDFHSLVGLDPTTASYDIGWDSSKQMELEFSAIMTKDGRPCILFNYNYVKP